jgi:hypothetical protein
MTSNDQFAAVLAIPWHRLHLPDQRKRVRAMQAMQA